MAKKNGVKVLNRPFHPSMLTIGTPSMNTKKFHRGWMIQSPEHGGVAGQSRYRINFLYNPSQIVVSHSVGMELASIGADASVDEEYYNHIDSLGPAVGQGSITIPLLFDRTYELWDSAWAKKPPGKFGVYWDVLAFYHFTNLTGLSTTKKTGGIYPIMLDPLNLDTEIWAQMYPISPMFPTQAYVYIGSFGSGSGSARLKYYGQITNLEINYTHWTHRMIPARCTVSVTMELLTDPNATGKGKKIETNPNPPPTGNSSGDPLDYDWLTGGP